MDHHWRVMDYSFRASGGNLYATLDGGEEALVDTPVARICAREILRLKEENLRFRAEFAQRLAAAVASEARVEEVRGEWRKDLGRIRQELLAEIAERERRVENPAFETAMVPADEAREVIDRICPADGESVAGELSALLVRCIDFAEGLIFNHRYDIAGNEVATALLADLRRALGKEC